MDLTTADPLIGQLFDGRYRVDARVARGGMATVYTGFDTRLDRVVAIKVMHQSLAEDDAFVGRFHREAKSAARLSHPNVVAIYDQGSDAGRVFLVMEHIDGGTLRARLRAEGRLTPTAALAVMEQVLSALAAAHDAGLVHRDVKPENILIGSDGRVKVADFGLARAIETTGMTTTGLLIGTVSYLAPEQVVSGRADQRSDVYSAGIVLFELLTGAPPYDGDTPLSVAYRHVNDTVPAPSSILAGLPPELDEVVLRATHRDPEARPGTARDLLVGVRHAQQAVGRADATTMARPLADAPTLITTRPHPAKRNNNHTRVLRAPVGRPPVVTPVRRRRRPRRGLVVSAVIAVLLLAASVIGWQLGLADRSSPAARSSATASEASSSAAVASSATAATEPQAVVPVDLVDVRTMAYDVAAAQLKDQGLPAPTRTDVFDETVKPGIVKEQKPPAGASVPPTAPVELIVSKGPERVGVPAVVGSTRTKALAALETARLKATMPLTERFDEKVPAGNVIAVNPVADAPVKPGTSVVLVISKGREPIPVPQLAGKTFAAAAKDIAAAKLNLTRKDSFSEKVTSGLVISQTPVSGTVFSGDTIALRVSKGPAPVAMPNVVGMDRKAAVKRLTGLGLLVRQLDYDGLKGKKVVRQTPSPGTLVAKGKTVDIYLL